MFSSLPHLFIYNRWIYEFLVNRLKSIIIIYFSVLIVLDVTSGPECVCQKPQMYHVLIIL